MRRNAPLLFVALLCVFALSVSAGSLGVSHSTAGGGPSLSFRSPPALSLNLTIPDGEGLPGGGSGQSAPSMNAERGSAAGSSSVSSDEDESAGTAVSLPELVLFAGGLFAAVLVSISVYAFITEDNTGVDVTEDEPSDESTESTDDGLLAGFGRVAGEFADRIERTDDAENEVYRAWHEMTTHLPVGNPETSTPTEFAAAARDAGVEDAHVETLTDLFRDVRYGDVNVTEERERRAAQSLRAVEDALGDG